METATLKRSWDLNVYLLQWLILNTQKDHVTCLDGLE